MTGRNKYDELTGYTWDRPGRDGSAGMLAASGASTITGIGRILVTTTDVRTPEGTFPLADCSWTVEREYTLYDRRPDWVLPVAIGAIPVTLGFSLFLLMVTETRPYGAVAVTVRCGSSAYTERVPIESLEHVNHIHMQLGYVRQWTESVRTRRR